jgi:DNA polymerase-3 subunit epsilon
MRQVILDVETTGLDPKSGHRLIEIGCVEVISKIKTGKVFHSYLNPEREVPLEAFKIHQISTHFLKDKPRFREVVHQFLDFIGDSELIIHNAPFDMGFINHELKALELSILANRIIDTLPIARQKFPGNPANLSALCKRFGISVRDRDAQGHGALRDSELLYHVYICLTEGLQSELKIHVDREVTLVRERVKLPPREFAYADDLVDHQHFIASIKNSIWKVNSD